MERPSGVVAEFYPSTNRSLAILVFGVALLLISLAFSLGLVGPDDFLTRHGGVLYRYSGPIAPVIASWVTAVGLLRVFAERPLLVVTTDACLHRLGLNPFSARTISKETIRRAEVIETKALWWSWRVTVLHRSRGKIRFAHHTFARGDRIPEAFEKAWSIPVGCSRRH